MVARIFGRGVALALVSFLSHAEGALVEFIVRVNPAYVESLASAQFAARRLYNGSASSPSSSAVPSCAAGVVLSLFRLDRRLEGAVEGGPAFSITYAFVHPSMASRFVLVETVGGTVEGAGESVLRSALPPAWPGPGPSPLLDVWASSTQIGEVASFGDRVDLDTESGGIGGGEEGPLIGGGEEGTGYGAAAGAGAGASITMQSVRNWGLDRIDQRLPPLDSAYSYWSTAGTGVDAYVLDTGVEGSHIEFEMEGEDVGVGVGVGDPSAAPLPVQRSIVRSDLGTNVLGDQTDSDTSDKCHGHGTMVSSLIAGRTVGVARRATIIPVRVIYCNGKFMVADILKGIDFALQQATKRAADGGRRAIINLSARCFGVCSALDDAADAAREAGVLFLTVAGNEGKDACATSPSRSKSVIAVAATRQSEAGDEWASFSNYGPCVTIAAPGQMLYGANYRGAAMYSFWSGTSFSTPLVAGVSASLWSRSPSLSNACVRDLLLALATRGSVRFSSAPDAANGTSPNVFLYSPSQFVPQLDRNGVGAAKPDFIWPATCVLPPGMPSTGANGAAAAAVRPPLSSVGVPDDGQGRGSMLLLPVSAPVVVEDSRCKPRIEGQGLVWGCPSPSGVPSQTEGVGQGAGWVTARVDMAILALKGRADTWAGLGHGGIWGPLLDRLIVDAGESGDNAMEGGRLTPLLSAIASLRSPLAWYSSLRAPDVRISYLELCLPTTPNHSGTHIMRCAVLPLQSAHIANAGMHVHGVGGGERHEEALERWQSIEGDLGMGKGIPENTSQVLLRVHVHAMVQDDPAAAALLLQSARAESILSSWLQAHSAPLATGLSAIGAKLLGVSVPRDKIKRGAYSRS